MSDFSAAEAVYEQIARKVAEERGCRPLFQTSSASRDHASLTDLRLGPDGNLDLQLATTRQRRVAWKDS